MVGLGRLLDLAADGAAVIILNGMERPQAVVHAVGVGRAQRRADRDRAPGLFQALTADAVFPAFAGLNAAAGQQLAQI